MFTTLLSTCLATWRAAKQCRQGDFRICPPSLLSLSPPSSLSPFSFFLFNCFGQRCENTAGLGAKQCRQGDFRICPPSLLSSLSLLLLLLSLLFPSFFLIVLANVVKTPPVSALSNAVRAIFEFALRVSSLLSLSPPSSLSPFSFFLFNCFGQRC